MLIDYVAVEKQKEYMKQGYKNHEENILKVSGKRGWKRFKNGGKDASHKRESLALFYLLFIPILKHSFVADIYYSKENNKYCDFSTF